MCFCRVDYIQATGRWTIADLHIPSLRECRPIINYRCVANHLMLLHLQFSSFCRFYNAGFMSYSQPCSIASQLGDPVIVTWWLWLRQGWSQVWWALGNWCLHLSGWMTSRARNLKTSKNLCTTWRYQAILNPCWNFSKILMTHLISLIWSGLGHWLNRTDTCCTNYAGDVARRWNEIHCKYGERGHGVMPNNGPW